MIKIERLDNDKITLTLSASLARWMLSAAWRHASKLSEGSRAARMWAKNSETLWDAYKIASAIDDENAKRLVV